jgi:hypothetical protein
MNKIRIHRAYFIQWVSKVKSEEGCEIIHIAGPFNTITKRLMDSLRRRRYAYCVSQTSTGYLEFSRVVLTNRWV